MWQARSRRVFALAGERRGLGLEDTRSQKLMRWTEAEERRVLAEQRAREQELLMRKQLRAAAERGRMEREDKRAVLFTAIDDAERARRERQREVLAHAEQVRRAGHAAMIGALHASCRARHCLTAAPHQAMPAREQSGGTLGVPPWQCAYSAGAHPTPGRRWCKQR